MESINDRFQLLIKTLGYNKNSFSKKIGLSSNSVIENIVSGRKSKPSYDVIFKTLSTFESISARWLITGEGDMNEKDVKSKEDDSSSNSSIIELKQKIIDLLESKIESLNQLVESKDETIHLLKNKCLEGQE